MEHGHPDPVGAGRVLLTGAGGQLGTALREAFPDADARTRSELDVTAPPPLGYVPGLVLHAAAWTDVDGAEADEAAALRANVEGTRNVVGLGAPVVYYSSDYVFDGTKREPYVESDAPAPLGAYGRSKLLGEQEVQEGWVVRSSWLFGWTGHNFVRTMLRLGARAGRGERRRRPARLAHLRRPPRRGDPGAVALPGASGTWPRRATAPGPSSRAAIFEEAGLDCRVVPISTAELGRPAPRPAYSVLRSERAGAPRLPHWREGLRECLGRLGV